MGLPDNERISMMRSAVLIHCTKHACYRQTDRQTDGSAVAFIRATAYWAYCRE